MALTDGYPVFSGTDAWSKVDEYLQPLRPTFDGGHLVFLGIEAVVRRPVPLRVREVASLLGLCVLVVLMGLAVKNDVEKRWDIIAAQAKELVG